MPEPSSTAAFVGRDDELAAMERAIAAARQGAPAVLLVGGDAGIGKSTLVAEGARRADADLIVGRCVPMGGDVMPLAPMADLLRNVRRANPDARTDHLAGSAPAALFPSVLELLAARGESGAVVVAFEDLHWADPLTWDLFDYLARNLVDEHVVLIGTYRANEVVAHPEQRRRLGEVARLPAARRIPLEGLSRPELARKIEALIGTSAPAKLVDEVLARSQGNPFFAAELVAAHLNGQAIPAVLSDLIASELDSLDADTLSVIAVVAAVGHDTTHHILLRVAAVEPERLERSLHAAIAARLLVVDHDSDAYRFRHALIGEVVYDELLPPERTRLHRRIAATLSDQGARASTRADRAGELALHLDRAGDPAAAFGALLHAADVAETVAPAAALRHLERALDLWDAPGVPSAAERRGDRLWQAAELAAGTVGNEHAAGLAREALQYGSPPRGAAWGRERLGRYLWATGRIEDSAAEYAAAAALLPLDAGPEAAPVFAGLAQAELMLGRYGEAETKARTVFELLVARDADPGAWSMARRVLGIVVDHGGDPVRGLELCREAVDAAPSASTKALAMLYLGVALLDAGCCQTAVDEMLDARAEARLTGLDRSFGGYLDALVAEGLTRLGRWSDAESVLGRSEGAEVFPLGEVRLALAGAMLASRRGDADTAHALLAEAESRPVDPFHRWFVDRTAAEMHVLLGEWAQGAAVAELASGATAPTLWQARFVMFGAIAEVELALDARARREPVDLAATSARLRQRIRGVEDTATADRGGEEAVDVTAHLAHAAAVVTQLGDPDPEAWAEAARRWSHLDDPFWRATARVREAEAAASVGATARAADALQDADRLAVGLGAARLLTDIEAVSRRIRLSVDSPIVAALEDAAIDRLGLTPREAEVLSLVAAGQTNRQIGEALYVSEKTASVHVSNILRKLGVNSRVDAAAVAQRLGVA